jgi:DNA invertase Pin-like site-specific DNA recombinase
MPPRVTPHEWVRVGMSARLALVLGKLEAEKLSARTKAGMAQERAKDIRIGRSKLGIEIRRRIAQRAAPVP